MQLDAGEALAPDREQPRVEVEPDGVEVCAQQLEVFPSPARDVEQRPRVRHPLGDQLPQAFDLARVVLECCVQGVVEGS